MTKPATMHMLWTVAIAIPVQFFPDAPRDPSAPSRYMPVFESEEDAIDWAKRHEISPGRVRPLWESD